MNAKNERKTPTRHGVVYILALVLLSVFSALSLAMMTTTSIGVTQADNGAAIVNARMAAESGLAYFTRRLLDIPPSDGVLLDNTADALINDLNGSPMLMGQPITYDDATIMIPTITMNDGHTFSATIVSEGADQIRLRVSGQHGGVARSVSMSFGMNQGSSGIFEYGIASRGPIRLTGNASVRGYNEPSEAKILSATYTNDEAFRLTGNCTLDYDIYASNPNAYATLTGNISIAGYQLRWWDDPDDPGENIYDHIHMGVGEVEFPEVDPTVFEPFATTIINSSTSTSGNKTFTNIRIAANSNKTFSGNITLKGVVYIEQPNRIRFTGNVNITGVIVTEDAGENVYNSNTVKFTGNTSVQGVEALPDTPEFSQLRTMPGSFLLAPGFGVQFTGNFGTVSGAMAAEKFTWTGNAGGIVRGTIISYSDAEFKLTGNSNIQIDRSSGMDAPPGFSSPSTLAPLPDTYEEN